MARSESRPSSDRETELLHEINRGLPSETAERYAELREKCRREMLSPEEHAELLHLIDQVELRDAERIERLAELARLRSSTLSELMLDPNLRIKRP